MSSRPLRFVQAGDFLLHQPLSGLMDVPEHLAGRLVEAPFQAARRVFDAALAAEVDFVLLAGNLCDPHRSGPRGLVFLAEQFARLAERGIAIYWATGEVDRRRDWPAQLTWPAGLHIFAPNRVEHLTHHRDGKPICQIAGRSIDDPSAAAQVTAAAFAPNPDGPFSIAILPAPLPFAADDLPAIGNHYWVCGGSSQAATTMAEFDPPCVVHSAGTPQGRAPRDNAPHGCTMVHAAADASINGQDQIHLSPIATDVVRWHDERIALPAPMGPAELEQRLQERMRTLIDAAGRSSGIRGNSVLLIRWHIDGPSSAAYGFDQSRLAAELLSMLRTEYGFREPPVWSVSLTFDPLELPASWCEQQTLLGEFLRRLQDLESANAEGPDLDCFLSQVQLAAPLAERLTQANPPSRANVLRQAAILGAELLSPGACVRDAAALGGSSRATGAISR